MAGDDTKIMRRDALSQAVPNPSPKASGVGVHGGKPTLFAKDEELPRLKAPLVIKACEQVASGSGSYRGVLYLSFARVVDVEALFEASRSSDVGERWKRLWVLAPFITKLTRTQAGRTAIALQLRTDLPALNLLGKFEQKRHASVRRLFARMHDELLTILLDALVAAQSDARRVGIFAQLIALVETDAGVLGRELKARGAEPLMASLQVRAAAQSKGMRTDALRDKLASLAPALGERGEGE